MPAAGLSWRRALPVIALALAGFALTLRVFYPGVMTFDAWYVHKDIATGQAGDWQSPVQTALWGLIEPLAPGAASMFVFIAVLYWLAFAAFGLALARRSAWVGIIAVVLALTPPAFVFSGIIWRDVLLAASWLFAAALAYAVAERKDAWRRVAQAVALAFLVFGFLMRPNGLFAAPIFAAYVLWPARFDLRRAALAYLPIAVVLAVLVPLVYYVMLNAKHQNVLHSIFVFDLAGITHFTGENQFPVTWSAEQNAMLTGPCYKPTDWDTYWTREPCLFVMKKLDAEKVFGSRALFAAWLHALATHPLAYLEHRTAVMANFLFNQNLTMWTRDIAGADPDQTVFTDNSWFMALKAINDRLAPTPLFRAGTWLLVCVVWCALGWRRRSTPEGAFLIGTSGSAVVYLATFFPAGVASDFRYALWAVFAALAGATVLGANRASSRAKLQAGISPVPS